MRKVLHDAALLFAAAAMWFGSAYFTAGVFVAYLGIPAFAPLPFWCGLTNLILGLLWIWQLTRSPKGAHLFYQEAENGNGFPFRLLIGLIWAIPLSLLLAGLWFRIINRFLP
jgi:hypothetical protein